MKRFHTRAFVTCLPEGWKKSISKHHQINSHLNPCCELLGCHDGVISNQCGIATSCSLYYFRVSSVVLFFAHPQLNPGGLHKVFCGKYKCQVCHGFLSEVYLPALSQIPVGSANARSVTIFCGKYKCQVFHVFCAPIVCEKYRCLVMVFFKKENDVDGIRMYDSIGYESLPFDNPKIVKYYVTLL